MPGKGHVPDLTERLVRTLRANTARSAGGLASNASPTLSRDRVRATVRGMVASTGVRVFVQPNTPGGAVKGDLWYDTDATC